jgi:hypothetical protein
MFIHSSIPLPWLSGCCYLRDSQLSQEVIERRLLLTWIKAKALDMWHEDSLWARQSFAKKYFRLLH